MTHAVEASSGSPRVKRLSRGGRGSCAGPAARAEREGVRAIGPPARRIDVRRPSPASGARPAPRAALADAFRTPLATLMPSWAGVTAGSDDLIRAAEALTARIPEPLGVLARLAYNYRWSWTPDGPSLFRDVSPDRWERCGENPVRLLQEASTEALERAAADAALLERAAAVEAAVARRPRPPAGRRAGDARPSRRLLLCGVRRAPLPARLLGRPRRARRRHPQGGVGPRGAARRGRPALPPGLLPPAHRRGRVAARVLGRHRSRASAGRARHRAGRRADHRHGPRPRPRGHGAGLAHRRGPHPALPARRRPSRERHRGALDHLPPLHLRPRGAPRAVHPARRRRRPRAAGDGHRPGPAPPQRGPRRVRVAGDGARRGRRVRGGRRGGAGEDDLHHAHAGARGQRHVPGRPGLRRPERPARRDGRGGRGDRPARPHAPRRPPRAVRRDAVRAAHEPCRERRQPPPRRGRARDVARPLAGPRAGRRADPPRHERRALPDVDRRADARGCSTATSPRTGSSARPTRRPGRPVDDIPDDELWAVRNEQRAAFVEYVREKSTPDRLGRDEPRSYAEAAAKAFDPEALTIGFARRLATYKRLYLLVRDADRALRMLSGEPPVQLVLAGKAHPRDDEGKRMVQHLFSHKWASDAGARVVYLDDYDLSSAARHGARLRRVAQPPAPAAGGERHERHEVGRQRRPAAQRARRLVGRGVRREQRLGAARLRGPRPRRPGPPRRGRAAAAARRGGRRVVLRPRRVRHPAGVGRADQGVAQDERPRLLGHADDRGLHDGLLPATEAAVSPTE